MEKTLTAAHSGTSHFELKMQSRTRDREVRLTASSNIFFLSFFNPFRTLSTTFVGSPHDSSCSRVVQFAARRRQPQIMAAVAMMIIT